MAANSQGGYDVKNQPNWSNPAEVEQYKKWLSSQKEPSSFENQVSLVNSGGYNMTPDMVRRAGDTNYGLALGQREFYDDPDMQRLRQLREEYAKGYSGEELGALRGQARSEIAGSQQSAQRKLASGLARGGVGGARAAAIQGTQAQQGVKAAAEAERKMTLDSAQMKRQGAADLQDYIFRQKYGKLGTGLGMASLGSADYAAQKAEIANRQGGSPDPLKMLLGGIDTITGSKNGVPFLGFADRLGIKV